MQGAPGYPPPVEEAAPPPPPGSSDHAGVNGTLGVGFFGVLSLPIIRCEPVVPACTPLSDLAPAPTIGARYWLSETLGIEAALGLNITSGANGNVDNSVLGFALHGGVPLALAHSGHFVFEIVPQLNFGVASGSYDVGGAGGISNDVSGLLIEAGAKVGGEIHFGFIDIPQLSLQGTVGLMVRHESRSLETIMGSLPTTMVEQSETRVATGVDGEPWDVFTGTITAIYYL
jgi:hypothetical protein